MRRVALLLVAVLAGCGSSSEGEKEAGSAKGGKSLTSCLKLWEGPHLGSTRMKIVAKNQVIAAKVEVEGGKCRVSFASKDGKVYGSYVEKPNVTGAWTKEAESAPVKTALGVVASANATGLKDGGLKAGAP